MCECRQEKITTTETDSTATINCSSESSTSTFFDKKCKPDFVETSQLTIVDPVIAPTSSILPHQFYGIKKTCCKDLVPKAPIVAQTSQEGIAFNAFNIQFYLRASAIDTFCKAEIAILTIPGDGFSFGPLVSFGADIAFTAITAGLSITINGTIYNLDAGGFAYIKAGSIFSFNNNGKTFATAELTAIPGSVLGFFVQVARYQEAVGSVFNLDAGIVRELAKQYCLYFTGASNITFNGVPINQLPGQIKFIPIECKESKAKRSDSACEKTNCDWGLECGQLLILSAINIIEAPGIKSSVTLKNNRTFSALGENRGFDCICEGLIVLPPDVRSAIFTATVILSPDFGSPEILFKPTINGLVNAEINTGFTFTVSYDPCLNNVAISPAVGVIFD